jgi:hypothetical protein
MVVLIWLGNPSNLVKFLFAYRGVQRLDLTKAKASVLTSVRSYLHLFNLHYRDDNLI